MSSSGMFFSFLLVSFKISDLENDYLSCLSMGCVYVKCTCSTKTGKRTQNEDCTKLEISPTAFINMATCPEYVLSVAVKRD